MKIAILDRAAFGDDADFSSLNKFGSVSEFATTEPDEIIKNADASGIVLTSKVRMDKKTLKLLPELKLICVGATGTNNIDIDAAKELNIAVTNVKGYSTTSVVQHTFTLLFSLIGHVSYYDQYVKRGEWAESKMFTHFGPLFYEIANKQWGIIGLGDIGRGVAEIAARFGAQISYFSPSGNVQQLPYSAVTLDELLTSSDIVSIHAPLTEKTKNLIQKKQLGMMKKNALLINVGRGSIVNEDDLAIALDQGTIKGAALDVLTDEPPKKDHPLFRLKHPERIIMTPHIAWASVESRLRLLQEIENNIASWLNGERRNRVD